MLTKTLETCLASAVEKTTNQVLKIAKGIPPEDDLGTLVEEVVKRVQEAPQKVRRIMEPNVLLRLCLLLGVLIAVTAVGVAANEVKVTLQSTNWKEAMGFIAHAGQALVVVVVPVVVSLVLLEGRLKRKKLLASLETLAQYIHAVYLVQFTLDPTDANQDKRKQLEYLDCCCGLMVLLRVAATSHAKSITDSVVLDRVARIGQASENSHRNLLLKIGLAQNSGNTMSPLVSISNSSLEG